MGKVVERRKKKGRPSLLDLQKRNLEEQLEQEQKQTKRNNNYISASANSNPNYSSATRLRRSTRRSRNSDSLTPEGVEDEDEDGEYNKEMYRKRRKKLKLVVRLQSQKSPANSSSLNSWGSDSNSEGDGNVASNDKKRKIISIREGSAFQNLEKGKKSISSSNANENFHGTPMDSGPSTPLPDKKLLVHILDRIQKKDIYGVFSEPVDPDELPDYHEIIEHPMDFGTVRDRLASGDYRSLEQIENDVLLIGSNGMQYNAPDTIYFRQAHTIHELAKQKFKNLRHDSDDNEPTVPKVTSRGRPPADNLKKPLGRSSLERAGSEFSQGVTLANSGEDANQSTYDSRKGLHHLEKASLGVFSSIFPVSSNNDAPLNFLTHNKLDGSDDLTGTVFTSNTVTHGKKQIVSDERSNTHKQFHPATTLLKPPLLDTFDQERKILLPVGLFLEHAYARSLSRFASDLGSVAWRVASKELEKSLPTGVKFGPGWVGENDIPQKRISVPQWGLCRLSTLQFFFGIENSTSAAQPLVHEPKGAQLSYSSNTNISLDKEKPSHPANPFTERAAAAPPLFTTRQSSELCRLQAEKNGNLNSSSNCNELENSIPICPRPSFQKHQSPMLLPGTNGCSGAYGFVLADYRGNLISASEPSGGKLHSPQMLDTTPQTIANLIQRATVTSLNPKDRKGPEYPSTLLGSRNDVFVNPGMGLYSHATRLGLSPQERTDAVITMQYKHPDLNVKFKSPGSSPASSKPLENGGFEICVTWTGVQRALQWILDKPTKIVL